MYIEKKEAIITIGEQGPVTLRNITGFLGFFHDVYDTSLGLTLDAKAEDVQTQHGIYVGALMRDFDQKGPNWFKILSEHPDVDKEIPVSEMFRVINDAGSIEVRSISMNSPLEIVVYCSLAALTLAVIISGGSVDLKVAKFELNPLGDGLAKLKKVFGKNEMEYLDVPSFIRTTKED